MTRDSPTTDAAGPERRQDAEHHESLLSGDAVERQGSCARCSNAALPGSDLCPDCYGEIAEDLCTSAVLERFSP